MSRVPRKHALLLAVFGVVAALVLVELAVRVATHSLFILGGPDRGGYSLADPVLGRIPSPGVSFRHPTKGFLVNIGEYGTRSNGNPPPRAQRPLTLAVGDSFAFGDEVDDAKSWPAVLERLSGRRVINAAVPGFGLDQSVLRAEQLADIYAPDVVIVSFIPHDVLRCEMSYWSGHAKPYFLVDSSGLHLHAPPIAPRSPYAPLKQLLAASETVDLLFPTFLHWEGPYQQFVHHRGREVACLLMKRLADLGRMRHARVVVLAQPQQPTATPEHLEIKSSVLECAAADHLSALDLFPVIESLPLERRKRLFHGHMTAEGNRLVAEELFGFLDRDTSPRDGAPAP